jgi:hypothetical protein
MSMIICRGARNQSMMPTLESSRRDADKTTRDKDLSNLVSVGRVGQGMVWQMIDHKREGVMLELWRSEE